MLFCSFWRLFTIKMIKSVKVFTFSFLKITTIFFLLHKIQTPGINMQNGRQVILTPWTLTLTDFIKFEKVTCSILTLSSSSNFICSTATSHNTLTSFLCYRLMPSFCQIALTELFVFVSVWAFLRNEKKYLL